MNIPYKVPLMVSTDGIAVNLGVQEPQSVALDMSVGVYAGIGNLQTKERAYTPTTTPQTDTITADEGFDGIDTVNISIDAVQAGAMMLAESYDVDPEIEINNAGKITARHNSTGSIAPVTDSGWLDAGGNVTLYFYGECEKQLPTQGATTITPTESAQTAVTSGKYTTGAVDVAGIPSNYVGSDVPLRDSSDLTASGATVTAPAGYYAANASKAVLNGSRGNSTVYISTTATEKNYTVKHDNATSGYYDANTLKTDGVVKFLRQQETVTPSTTSQTVTPAGSTYYLDSVTVDAMPAGTEGTPTATKGAVNNHAITVTPSVTNTAGYITGGTKTGTGVSVSASELVSGDKAITSAGTTDVTNYETATVAAGSATMPASISTNGTIAGALNNTMNVHATATATPTVSAGYVASGTSGSTSIAVNVPVTTLNATTYNPQSTDRTIASGTYTIGTQTIKGAPLQNKTVTNNGDVTADAGYYGLGTVTVNVSGGSPTLETVTKSYTPTESAQSETVTPGAGYDGIGEIDISVGAIPSNYVGSGITQRTSSDLTASGATVTAPSGYYASNATKTVQSGSVTSPSTISGSGATLTTGTNTITLQKTLSVTPNVTTAGYISSGTAGNALVSLNANVTTKGATTYNPSATQQTIASGTYLTGTQTIAAAPLQNKTVTANGNVTADAGYYGLGTVTVNVSGGGGSKNVQVLQSTTRTTSTSYTKLCGDITVAKTGTYDVYWTGFRSSTSGTWGTQLYIGSTAYGTAQTTFSNHVQTVHLSNVSLTADQKVSVYGRSRGSNYYAYVGMLTIVES